MKVNFYINRNLEGFLMMNHPQYNKVMKTYGSTKNGRFWFEDEFKYPDKSGRKKSVYFDFQLNDPQSVPKNFQWIDIQYKHVGSSLQPFATLDGAKSWNAIPKTRSKVVMLSYGTVILSVEVDSIGINYSLDQTATWLRHDVFKNKPTVLYIGRISETDLKAVIVTSEPGVDDLLFTTLDFSNIFKFDCEAKHYREVPLEKAEGYCYRGKNVVIRTRDPSIRCVDKLTEHIQLKSDCACTPDDYSCIFNYHSFNDMCVLDPLSDVTEAPYDCGSGSYFDMHQMGYVKMAHDSCDPHELHLGVNMNSSDLCVENEWTNFLYLYDSTNLFLSQIMSDGSHFRKQIYLKAYLSPEVNINSPIAFDLTQKYIYTFLGKYITQFRETGTSHSMLYYVEDKILDMDYDSVLGIMIFLTGRNQLKLVSLSTNYQQLVAFHVTKFQYSPHHKLVSYVMAKNTYCFCKIFEDPVCTKYTTDIAKFYIDFTVLKAYILTKSSDLIINKFTQGAIKLQTIFTISNVADFVFYDDHLYFLSQGKLMYQNVNHDSQYILLGREEKFTRLSLHRETLESYRHACQILNCQFLCHTDSENKVACGCPAKTQQVKNKCECPPETPYCLMPYCSGFFCKNSKCLLNNVRCNGVDDCGDGTDEANCPHLCSKDMHMCRNVCVSKQTVCDIVDNEIPVVPTPKPKLKRIRGVYIFLIILLCLVAPYPLYRLFRECYRRYMRRRLRLRFWTQTEDNPPEFQLLIEPEINPMVHTNMS
ncbi:Sortilin-related receptor [Thelohanellus kitauei]|uniref:Sortilin-related receptor n=1 Tax=Thelohanellus kitauei TaxID=669202 RepID=A0A0C2NBE8_THEKT|nr:Sortilin-related receptor [Thelohanellus kitauei]